MKKIITYLSVVFLICSGVKSFAQCTPTPPWQPRNNSPSGLNQLVPFQNSGGPANYYRNDDEYTAAITLPFTFCFWGQNVNTVYISNNGYITWPSTSLLTSSQTYMPVGFPYAGYNIIAPCWQDVYTLPVASNSSFAMNTVWYLITPHYMVVQWDSVGFYASQTQHNSFQVMISDGTSPIIPNGNNIDFCYLGMNWAEGNATSATNGFYGNNPATVGVNDANGINFIQIGRFDSPGNGYYGSNPSNSGADGIAWLDNKEFQFNTCTGEAPPIVSDVTPCDTFKVCEGSTLDIGFAIYSPIPTQTIHSSLQNPIVPGTSIIYNTPGNRDSIVVQVVGSAANLGYNRVYFYGFDNHNPSDTTFSSFVIDVQPGFAVNITANPSPICVGASSLLSATGGGTYLWSTGATTSSTTVTPAITTTYSVQVTNGCVVDTNIQVVVNPAPTLTITPVNASVCGGDSAQLTVAGAATYTWTPATGLSCTTCANPKAAPAVPTTYTVTGVSASGCSATGSVTVNINPTPTVVASTSQDSICLGHSVSLNATGAATYSWTPTSGLSCNTCANPTATPTVTTTYVVTGTAASGCTSKDSVRIVVANPNNVNVTASTSVCLGDSTTLVATGGSSYVWNPGNISGPTLNVKPAVTSVYTVTIATPCGTVTQSVTVNVNPKPVPVFTSLPDSGCAPVCVQFTDQSTIASGHIKAWKWEFGDGSTLTTQSPLYCYNRPGAFNVSLITTSDSGCMDSITRSDLINVFSHPSGNFTYTPQSPTILNPTVQFTNNISDAYGMPNWYWNFGERGDTVSDTTSILQNPSHAFGDTGTFCVSLVAVNRHGCRDSVFNCLVVEPQFVIYIPDAFTPNGDNKNDIFLPQGNFVAFEMYIYDRWGMEIFHTTNPTQGWNGKVNGGLVSQEDTYIYLVKVTDPNNQKHTYTGEVNLIK